jgi:hypothetical protein
LNGLGRGCTATLLSIDQEKFSASVKIDSGDRKGTVVTKEYEDISKYAGAGSN